MCLENEWAQFLKQFGNIFSLYLLIIIICLPVIVHLPLPLYFVIIEIDLYAYHLFKLYTELSCVIKIHAYVLIRIFQIGISNSCLKAKIKSQINNNNPKS